MLYVLYPLSHAFAQLISSLSFGAIRPPPPYDPATTEAALLRARTAGGRPDVSRALRTLVRVHGVQMLLDGVYNCDPHPGNVLLLPDGRLGLIDYGMVGRLTPDDRRSIARVVVGLAAGDMETVVREYTNGGYRATSQSGRPHGPEATYRLATFHLDRIDLSPVRASSGGPPVPIFKLLHNTIERRVPDWVEQGRRLGALLIGVGSQSGRPFSLSHEWAPIAEEALFLLDEHGNSAGLAETTDRPREANKVRLKTHLTGLT